MSERGRPDAGRVISDPRLDRIASEVHGPRDHLEADKFRRLQLLVQRVKYPWDVLLAFGIIGGLFGLALLGVLVVIWSWTWLPGTVTGIAMVGISAGVSSHPANRWGV